jgi:hypothetical protein
LTEEQKAFLEEAQSLTKTLNRDAVAAYKYLCKVKGVENWICQILQIEPPKRSASFTQLVNPLIETRPKRGKYKFP